MEKPRRQYSVPCASDERSPDATLVCVGGGVRCVRLSSLAEAARRGRPRPPGGLRKKAVDVPGDVCGGRGRARAAAGLRHEVALVGGGALDPDVGAVGGVDPHMPAAAHGVVVEATA